MDGMKGLHQIKITITITMYRTYNVCPTHHHGNVLNNPVLKVQVKLELISGF